MLGLQGQVPDWLQNSHKVSNLYSTLYTTQQQEAKSVTMEPSACQATYLLGLSKPHALQEQSVAPERDPSPLLFWQDQPLEVPLPTLPISEGLFSILL